MPNLIDLAFKKVKQENRPALLTYTVAGDNSKKKSIMDQNPKRFNLEIDIDHGIKNNISMSKITNKIAITQNRTSNM